VVELRYRLRNLRVAAVIVLAIAAGVVAWLLLRDEGGSDIPVGKPRIVSAQQLSDLASSEGHPVYWAGALPKTRLELTKTKNGNVYVRYLGPKDQTGDPHPNFLTVGTYPLENAFGALTRASKRPGAVVAHTPDGALVVTAKALPTSVYIAYPQSGLQTEVFDPSPKRARDLAVSGKIQPIK
jgi:hypothetical protein